MFLMHNPRPIMSFQLNQKMPDQSICKRNNFNQINASSNKWELNRIMHFDTVRLTLYYPKGELANNIRKN